MAEYVAGQIIGEEMNKLPNIRQALMQVQEHAKHEADMGGVKSYVMETKNMFPSLRNFAILRSTLNFTQRFLASDLDRPSQPKGQEGIK